MVQGPLKLHHLILNLQFILIQHTIRLHASHMIFMSVGVCLSMKESGITILPLLTIYLGTFGKSSNLIIQNSKWPNLFKVKAIRND